MDVKNIHWLGHASFRIEDGGKQIYVDPWKLPASSPPAHLILVTHSHYDHFSVEDIRRITGEATVLAMPPEVGQLPKGSIVAVEPGTSYTLAGYPVETVPAYNLGKKFHPKTNHWVGYIITLTTGERIYHAGDTDVIPEMKNVRVEIALLPCGGTYTMTAAEAAEAARAIKPDIVIPMHWGDIVGSRSDAELLKKLLPGQVEIKTPER